MDGFRTAGALGILYAEDFGRDPPSTAPAPAAAAALTQADIDRACIRAVAAAQDAWSDTDDARRADALVAVRDGLAAIRQQAAEHAEAVADGIARAALSALAAALPHVCRAHGDAEVRALLRHVLPLVAARARVVLRVHAGLIDALRQDIERFDDTLIDQIELRAANLPPGDVRLNWEDGGLVRDGAAIRAAIEDGLTQLGLLDADPSDTPTGSPAHAQ